MKRKIGDEKVNVATNIDVGKLLNSISFCQIRPICKECLPGELSNKFLPRKCQMLPP